MAVTDHRPAPLKVAQFLYGGLGGHGSVAFSLINGDQARSWSHALCFIGVESLFVDYSERCTRSDIPFTFVRSTGGRPWQTWKPVLSWLEDERPDALLVHSATVLPVCFLYARRHRIPLVVVEHHNPALKRRRDWLLTIAALQFAERVIVLTGTYARELRRRLGPLARARKISIIPNGIDVEKFAPGQMRASTGKLTLGMAGRFSPPKRQDVLVDAIASHNSRQPDGAWHLSLAGDGPLRTVIEEGAKKGGPADIRLMGALNEQDLADWFRSLDIYVHASEGETLSTAILQAMATGLPIAASDVSGITEQVTEDIGVLVKTNSSADWIDAISFLSDNPQFAAARGQAGRQRCLQHHSANTMFANYDRLLRELISRL